MKLPIPFVLTIGRIQVSFLHAKMGPVVGGVSHTLGNGAMTIQTQTFEVLERVVKARGTSGGVYLSISWTGKRVKVLLLDPVENEK